jgi:predicted alpha/beta superfamily hydrolase
MLVEEIKPLIDRRFRTKPDRLNTAVGGSSFGGILTLHIGLTRPDVFGKLLVVSPSVWWDGRVILKSVDSFKGPKPKVWIDMGTQEGPNSLRDARDLYASFLKRGWKSPREVVFVEEGFAQHNEEAWARRFPSMLQYLFGRR